MTSSSNSPEARPWRSDPRVWVSIVVALLLWAAAFAGIRAGLRSYGPGQVALLRFATASAVLALYAIVTRMRLPDRKDLPVIMLAGVLGITVYHVALNFGEQTVTAGAAALLISTSPIFTAIFSAAFLKEKVTLWGWGGIAISFAGVALITLGEGNGMELEFGAIIILIAALAASAYMIVGKRPLRRYSALQFTTYMIWAGTVPLLVFAPGLITQMQVAEPASTWAVLFLGVFPGALSYVLWSYALSRMPASVLATFLYAQPANATLVAWAWLGELPSSLAIIGGVISLAGVVVVNSRGVKETGTSAPLIEPALADESGAARL
ncbi:MAG: DMT family transporter [Actinobacteria bacterium]|nr:DMT family transporter [Actinomycetota bacterium]